VKPVVGRSRRVITWALEETENALVAYREAQQRLVRLAEQARESTRAADLARIRYREGAADFLSLLDAERTQLQAEDAVAAAEADVFTSVIALYKALGGIPATPAPGARAARLRRRTLRASRSSSCLFPFSSKRALLNDNRSASEDPHDEHLGASCRGTRVNRMDPL
jgi:hypothetical protein